MQSSCREWKRRKVEGKTARSMEAATNSLPSSHALSLHPGVHGWAERPDRACTTGWKGLLGFVLQLPKGSLARRETGTGKRG